MFVRLLGSLLLSIFFSGICSAKILQVPDRFLSKDPKVLFELSANPTKDELKGAYRKLISRFHPDRLADLKISNPELFKKASDAAANINAVFANITSSRKTGTDYEFTEEADTAKVWTTIRDELTELMDGQIASNPGLNQSQKLKAYIQLSLGLHKIYGSQALVFIVDYVVNSGFGIEEFGQQLYKEVFSLWGTGAQRFSNANPHLSYFIGDYFDALKATPSQVSLDLLVKFQTVSSGFVFHQQLSEIGHLANNAIEAILIEHPEWEGWASQRKLTHLCLFALTGS